MQQEKDNTTPMSAGEYDAKMGNVSERAWQVRRRGTAAHCQMRRELFPVDHQPAHSFNEGCGI